MNEHISDCHFKLNTQQLNFKVDPNTNLFLQIYSLLIIYF